jgi:hypothetical protein
MKAQTILASKQQRLRGLNAATLLLLTPLLLTLGPQSALGQGLKMTQVHMPGSQDGTTIPTGVNTSQAVVGSYGDGQGDTWGFSHIGGTFATIAPPTAYTFARANGINDSNTIIGDFLTGDGRYHGFIYSGGKYTTYNENTTESCGVFGLNNGCATLTSCFSTLGWGF